MKHEPVMLEEALEHLAIRPDGTYVDATFGAGGHSRAILERLTSGRLIAFDADLSAKERAAELSDPRFQFIPSNFLSSPINEAKAIKHKSASSTSSRCY